MKISSFLATVFFVSSATAAAGTTVVSGNVNQNVANLKCVQRFVPDRQLTELSELDHAELHLGPLVELQHRTAVLDGCDTDALRAIVESSRTTFGFVLGAPIQVTKVLEPSFVNGLGSCVARFTETVSITLGPTTVVQSENGQLRQMTDCRE